MGSKKYEGRFEKNMITVELPDGKTVRVCQGTVDEILLGLGMNPYEVLAVCNDELLFAEDIVEDNTILKLVSIVHGG